MKLGRRWFFLVFILIISNVCFSQSAIDVPVVYLNQFNTFLTTNPAAIVDTSKLELGSFYNAFTGGFSKIRNFEAYCFYRPTSKSSWLVEINSDQQGPVFKKNKIYGGYMQHLQLSEKWNAQLGAKIGAVNYAFKPSQSGVGGSDFALDGTLSLSFFTRNWLFGSAMHQFTSSSLQPIDQIFVLGNYWETQAYYLLVKPYYTVKSGVRFRLTDIQNVYQISSQLELHSMLIGGSVSNIGYTMSIGYAGKTSEADKRKTLLSFLYYIPSVENLQIVHQNRLEIIVKVFIAR